MKFIILVLTFAVAGCLQFEKEAPTPEATEAKTSASSDLYFGTQQEPLVALDYVLVEITGERVDLENLNKLKITGSNLGNSNEYGGSFIKEGMTLKQIRDPKDQYFNIEWTNKEGQSFSTRVVPDGGKIRL